MRCHAARKPPISPTTLQRRGALRRRNLTTGLMPRIWEAGVNKSSAGTIHRCPRGEPARRVASDDKGRTRMKTFLMKLRDVAVAGFFFLLPVIVVLIIITKAWVALTSGGAKLATMFGMKTIVGLAGSSVFTSLLLIVICLACGLLVRVAFVSAFGNAVEAWLAEYIPGYATYKAMAEEKLQNKIRLLPYQAALIRHGDFWRPAYVVEQDRDGNAIVFVPEAPDTTRGNVLLAAGDQVTLLSTLTANQLDTALKAMGKGLLTEHRLRG